MTDDLPAAVWSGTLTLFGVELRCHVLDTGQRIIEADSMADLLEAMSRTDLDREASEAEVMEFVRWMRGMR